MVMVIMMMVVMIVDSGFANIEREEDRYDSNSQVPKVKEDRKV